MTRPSTWRDEADDYRGILDRIRRLELAQTGSHDVALDPVFPPAPLDGRDFYYQLPLGGVWHFKFNASSGYWEFVGGPPMTDTEDSALSISSDSTWRDPSTVGPSITIPWAGDYYATLSCNGYANGVASSIAAGLGVGAWSTPSNSGEAMTQEYVAGATQYASLAFGVSLTLAQDDELRARYWGNGGGGQFATFGRRRLALWPVRVTP